jgi:hypothetical protein
MELKSAERDVQDLELLYLRVRRYDDRLPPLDCDGNDDDPTPGASNEVSPAPVVTNDDTDGSSSLPPASATEAMRRLEDCRDRTETLQERIAKLERRLGDNDPVTGTPRYGEQTLARVATLLRRYRRLQSAKQQCFPTTVDGESGATTSENAAVTSMRHAAQLEEDEARRSSEEEAARLQREEEEREAAERRRVDEAKRKEEEAARAEELRIAEQARQAQEARMGPGRRRIGSIGCGSKAWNGASRA